MITAVIPVKPLDRAKGRLASVLSAEQRRGLVTAMLADLVSALQLSAHIGRVLVVSPDSELLKAAGDLGTETLPEPEGGAGLNAALSLAATRCAEAGAESMLVLPVDVPAVSREDIDALAAARRPPPSAVLVPGADGGTTALLASPPDGVPLRFGPESARRHREAFEEAGIAWVVLDLPSLARDLDRPEDAAYLLSLPGAPRTRAALAAAGLWPRRE